MMNALSHPHALAMNGMVAGAARAPTDAPLLKMAVAKARSFFGKYSAVTLMADGKLPDSPNANMRRQAMNRYTDMVEMDRANADPLWTAIRASLLGKPSICMVSHPQPA